KAYDVSKAIISSKNISKTIWGIINNKSNPSKITQIKIGNRLLDDETKVANEFNNFFATVACDQGPRPSAPLANSTRRQILSVSMGLAPGDEKGPSLLFNSNI
ncbi:hypothetical protein J6590_079096, partial [Homalodisca vitripennis]